MTSRVRRLSDAIRAWWAEQESGWSPPTMNESPASDLWDQMPVVDSKSVARSSPIFEEHLGVKLDVKLIRPGGYSTIDEMIQDVVPKMVATIPGERMVAL